LPRDAAALILIKMPERIGHCLILALEHLHTRACPRAAPVSASQLSRARVRLSASLRNSAN
jgi:hypothetical protein